jgi:PAS domain S-box-containing protein
VHLGRDVLRPPANRDVAAMKRVLIGAVALLLAGLGLDRGATPDSGLGSRYPQGLRLGYAVEAPYAFVDSTGRVTGAIPELAREVARRLGVPVTFVQSDFGALLDQLEEGRYDVVAAGLFITPERARRVRFSVPSFQTTDAALVRRGNPKRLHSLDDVRAAGATVVVLAASVEEVLARRAGIPPDRTIAVPDGAAARRALESGRADLLLNSECGLAGPGGRVRGGPALRPRPVRRGGPPSGRLRVPAWRRRSRRGVEPDARRLHRNARVPRPHRAVRLHAALPAASGRPHAGPDDAVTHQARLHRLREATRHSRRRSLAAVVVSALLCVALVWLSFEQREAVGHGLEAIAALRTARADLARGAVDVAVAAPGSANDASQGLVRIAQALDGLERAEADLQQPAEHSVDLAEARRLVATLQQQVRNGAFGDGGSETALMAAIAGLDRRAAALDGRLRSELAEATRRADVTFRVALVIALVLLVWMAVVIVAAERGLHAIFRDWRETDRELMALFNALPALIWFKDRDNRIRRVNAVAADVAGRPVEDIEGRPADEVFPLDTAQDRPILEAGAARLGELEHLPLPAGQLRWYRVDRVPYQGGDGALDGMIVVARDTTEIKATDDALLDERNRLAAIAAAAPTVLHSFRQAPDGTMSFPYASPRIEELYGLTPAELARDASVIVSRCHPDDRARVASAVEASRRTMTPWHEEFRVIHPVKGEIWVEANSVPCPDPDGGVTWHGAMTDVTERRRVQQALQDREELLEQTGEIAQIGVWELDPATGRGRWTAEVARIHDLDPTATPALAMGLDFYPGEARGRVEAAVRGALEGVPYDIEVPFVSATGVQKWVRTSGRPVVRDGKVVMLRGAIHDITSRKRAEQAMQDRLALEERLSMLAAMSPAAMYTFRLGPDGAMSFPYASARVEEMFGVSATGLAASADPALALIHPEDQPRILASIQRSAAEGTAWVEELRFQHPSRGTLWVEGRARPTRQPDGSTLWYGTLLDVTDRHRLEAELLQAQKMEAIGRLAGGVAHDFNNLLTVILGNATQLLEEAGGGDEVREIVSASERAANLTKQLLLFSRKQVMQRTDVDLNAVLGNLTRMLQRILGEDVALRAEFAPGLPTVRADQGMMEQVLLNLAVNSRDAMPGGGELHITTRLSGAGTPDPRRPADLAAGSYVCVSVRDTGAGIAPETLPRIFEPFFTTKEAGKGTGLGLATVYGIVTQHEGGVAVESTVGVGTTFHVYLPVRPPEAAGVAAPADTATVARGRGAECVLVVEDETAVRELAARVLARDGYRVLTAESGREALTVWESHRGEIALVMTDLVMPGGMTGFALAERLTADRPDLRIVYTTGYSRELSAGAVSLVPGVDFLEKPYRREQLLAVVRRRLDAPAERPAGTQAAAAPPRARPGA